MPHLGSGITWMYKGRRVMATPNLREGVVSVIDIKEWKPVGQIRTLGPGFFMRSHENTRYAWVDAMMSPTHRDTLQVIDKDTLEVVAELRPEPGKTLAHVEFTRDGRYALASLWEMDGALIVYRRADAQGGEAHPDEEAGREVQRLQQDHEVRRHEPLGRRACATMRP